VIDEMVEHKLDEKAERVGELHCLAARVSEEIGAWCAKFRGKGVLRGVELVKDTRSMQPFPELGKALKRTALDNGLILRVDPSWFAVCRRSLPPSPTSTRCVG